MIIVCPNCQLRGELTGVSTSFRTHVTCARCATPFGVAWLNGEGVRIDEEVHKGANQSGENRASKRPDSLLERLAGDGPVANATPVALPPPQPPQPLQPPTTNPAPTSQPNLNTKSSLTPQAGPTLPLSQSKLATGTTPTDSYDKGARLMRVSPLTLLLGGIALIGFVVFLNWLLRPNGGESETAALNQSRPRAQQKQTANFNSREAAATQTSGLAASEIMGKADRALPADNGPLTPIIPAGNSPQAQPADGTTPAPTQQAGFTVQLGSFNLAEEAEVLVQRLATAGVEARIDPKLSPKGKTWYRVRSGLFPTHDEAAAHGSQLRSQKLTANFIIADAQDKP